jgi:cytochrome c oxidase subunit 2
MSLSLQRFRLVLGGFGILIGLVGCGSAPVDDHARAVQLYQACGPCHGTAGLGTETPGTSSATPAIAGLPAWYITAQVEKFRSGARGKHPEDYEGLRMRPMSRYLRNAEDLATVATYIEGLAPMPASVAASGGDAAKGAGLYATCMACHQADGSGMEALGAPPLTTTQDWYLVSQLRKFKEGIRGVSPDDVSGATMRPFALMLSDEQAMKDVVAHIRTLSN